MLVEEKNCLSISPNGQRHSDNFNDTLTQALRFAKAHTPSKYNEAVEKYVTSRMNVVCRAASRNDNNEDSDDSWPPKKRGKTEDVDTDYMERFYRFFLGKEVNANNTGLL